MLDISGENSTFLITGIIAILIAVAFIMYNYFTYNKAKDFNENPNSIYSSGGNKRNKRIKKK